MGWRADLAELSPWSPHKEPSRRVSAKTFVYINLSDDTLLKVTNDTATSECSSAPPREETSCESLQLDEIFAMRRATLEERRRQALGTHSSPTCSATTKSQEEDWPQRSGAVLFSSSILLRMLPPRPVGDPPPIDDALDQFRPAEVRIHTEGFLSVVFGEADGKSTNSSPREALCWECTKVLCFRYDDSALETNRASASELREIAVGLSVFHDGSADNSAALKARNGSAHMLTPERTVVRMIL